MVKEKNEHIYLIGVLLTNLQSLELMIRATLYEVKSNPHNPSAYGTPFSDAQVGDEVEENAITDFSTLGQLIGRYNTEVATSLSEKIPTSVVDIRDAFAHGRITSPPSDTYKDFVVIKYSRSKNSKVTVTYRQNMTTAWLKNTCHEIYGLVMNVKSKLDAIQKINGTN